VRQLPVLFTKIPPEEVEKYREQFGGGETE